MTDQKDQTLQIMADEDQTVQVLKESAIKDQNNCRTDNIEPGRPDPTTMGHHDSCYVDGGFEN